jgi:hypothetical protein
MPPREKQVLTIVCVALAFLVLMALAATGVI